MQYPGFLRRTAVTFLFAVAPFVAGQEVARNVQIGAARIDITPEYPVRLSGYGSRRTESEGVAQRLYAKAIAIRSGPEKAGPAVWISYENCGLTSTIREQVAKELEAAAHVPSDRLVISVTHTHTAPCLSNWAPYIFGGDIPPEHQQRIDAYTETLTGKLVKVALAAIANQQPAELHWGQGKVGFAVNRRVLRDGKWSGFGVQPDGPVDHSLPVLIARDRQGKTIACVANYACHCTTLGGNFNRICGDWAGYAQEFIEQEIPGCVAMITIGCGADANPDPRKDDLAVCQQQGRQLAEEVARLAAGGLKPVTGELQCRHAQIELPYDAPRTDDEWRERAKRNDAIGYHARKFLERIERSRKNPKEQIPTSLPYPVATWTFGDELAIVFLGGEVVVDYALRMKTEFDADRLWITAYSNDVPCYIPSRRILAEGGYEADQSLAYYARPQRLSGDVEDLIVDTVQKLLPHAFYSRAKQVDFPPPKSPDESLAAIRLRPGWKVELVANEPLVEDPVAFDWTPDGRLWVAEMRDYPNGIRWNGPSDPMGQPGGRVKLLTDRDGNGQYDHATVFLDDLPFPTGVKTWRNGVLVSMAPSLIYAEDTNGDGVADKRETLFEGFAEGNQQHRVNGMRWGIDNWLHLANGDSGGTIKSSKTGKELSISGRDLRIRPDDGSMDAQSGQTQFGRCRDEWGNWFGGNNANPLWHYVLDDYYLRRNPHFAAGTARRDVPETPGTSPVFPASRTLARFNDFHTANRFTSACSPEIYRDEHLSHLLDGGETSVFICEPVHNLVHREVMHEDGVSFRSRRAASEQQTEFFASADNWSRPVMIRTGPDGALWIADMYRQVIEHPQWIPVNWQRKLDLRAGSQRGRIYRVTAADESRKPFRSLAELDTRSLAGTLHSPNGWQRDMAQQMLIWRADKSIGPLLEQIASGAERPTARLHALATLEGLGLLKPAGVRAALSDKHPGVRRLAVRLAESVKAAEPGISAAIGALANDESTFVRQQVAYTLGEFSPVEASNRSKRSTQMTLGSCLASIALRDREDPFMLAAVLSSVRSDNIVDLVDRLLESDDSPASLIDQLAGIAAGMGDASILRRMVATSAAGKPGQDDERRMKSLVGLLSAMRRGKSTPITLLDQETLEAVETIVRDARNLVSNQNAPDSQRIAAVRLLGAQPVPRTTDAELLMSVVSPQSSPELQSAAVGAVTARFPDQAAARLLSGWQWYSPSIRAQVLDTLFVRSSWALEFLASVERESVHKAHIDARRRQQLLQHPDEGVRERARKLFETDVASTRSQVVEQFRSVVTMAGDRARGKTVFGKRCGTCHKLEDAGQGVGPDLTSLTDKSPGSMLVAILDPNKAVEDKFLDYLAVTTDGRQFTGMMVNETSNDVTLVGQEGKQVSLRRNEIEMLRSSGKSMMPEGLEKDLTAQDIADVIAYVRETALPPKQFPGNIPEVAHVRDDGSIRMLAIHAKIYGPKLVLEEKYRNLGYWQSPEDRAVWTLNVPKAGKYRVAIEYACDDSAAGDRFVLIVGEQTLGGVVAGTGSWDRYRSQTVGTMVLSSGMAELTMRSDGPIRSALIDLRQIVLHPE